jgi:hypothetical protein
MSVNAAIFILTQNTDVRKTYLKTSLYFLFRNFNSELKYPVVILHEGDFSDKAQTEIIMGIRRSCRSCVSFRALDPDDFKVPDHIDMDKLKRCIETKPTPYWRNIPYRNMCRWWLVHMPKYAKGYDYVMRLDDDSIIEEPVPDLFAWAKEKDLVYASNMLHTDCGICNYGMKDFFINQFPDKRYVIDQLFITQDVPSRAVQVHPFRTLLSITQDPPPEVGEKITLPMPIMFYNNFFITKSAFWQRDDVKEVVDAIDKNGSIYYFRWGDAPLHTILVQLLAKPEEVSRSVFKYSKRMQRESFLGEDKMYHDYMPLTYDKSSCMTEDKQ